MAIPLVDLKAQYQAIKPEIDAAVERIFENTSFVLGAEVASFEDDFATYCGAQHAVGVSSGTAALGLALMACGVGPGDEVITTPATFIATSAAISHVGATPVFVDVDSQTYNLNPEQLVGAITSKTRAVLPVHLYGQPADMSAIMAVANAHELVVIEDACQAVGAEYDGRRAGALGHVGCFSFYPSKNLGAAGDGGMLVTNDDEIAEKVLKMRDHGRTSHYGHSLIGYTYRLDALQAAVLAVKLRHLDAWNAARRECARVYNQLLAGADVVTPYEPASCQSVYHIYAVLTANRDAVLKALRDQGIGASIHYPLPVHLQPAYAHLGLPEGSYPVAEALANRTLSLPIYPELTRDQQEQVASALLEIVN